MTYPPELLPMLRSIVGDRNLILDPKLTAPFSEDIRGYVRTDAALVVLPSTTQQVSEIVTALAEFGIPFVPQGGNTGLCAGAVPSGCAQAIINLRRMNRIEWVDPDNNAMQVEAGAILSDIRDAATQCGRLFPLSIGSQGSCQIGGNIATNAGGHSTLRYGNTRSLVLGLEVVLPDGRIWNGLKSLRKDNTGIDLKQLFIGSEGTLGLITRAVLALSRAHHRRETALAVVAGPAEAGKLLHLAWELGESFLVAFEYMDRTGVELAVRHVPSVSNPLTAEDGHYVLLEFGLPRGFPSDCSLMESVLSGAFEDGVVHDAVIASTGDQRHKLWALREGIVDGLRTEGGIIAHDISVAVSKVADFVMRATVLVEQAHPGSRAVPFGHLGDGNLHFNIARPEAGDAASFLKERGQINRIVYDLVDEFGGSFSAEHGVGQLKLDDMLRYKPPLELELMKRVKQVFDPTDIANRGKVFPGDE